MWQRFSPIPLFLFLFVLAFLLAFIQLGILSIVFDKLGLSMSGAYLLLLCSLFGSAINIPLVTIHSEAPQREMPLSVWQLLRMNHLVFENKTVIAVNVGGGIIPFGFSLYLLANTDVSFLHALLGIGLVAVVSYIASRPIHGLGIGMPILIAPISAALAALLIDPAHSAPLAYIAGTLGVIIGADLLRLRDIRHMGTPIASIGGAGTFDGIFITGIVAVLLA
ncbi:MAG: DUF1614 domain-containing protein [Gammaproteobacteria bacterium]|nr:DUF1614 domain-containing protein [Gammaproteobacteria bacterium]